MLHFGVDMNRIADALEFLTAQHDEIDALLAELSTSTSIPVRTRAISALAETLTLHLAIEQELLYPVAPAISDEVRTELMSEHGEIKRVLADLLWVEVEDPRFAPKLVTLKTLLEWHEVWQEAQLFETIAESLRPDELAALGSRLHAWIDGVDGADAVATAA